jgi:PTS system galactitol-specific IIC component
MPEGAVEITSIGDGFLWPVWLFTSFTRWFGGVFGLLIVAVLIGVLFFFYLRNPKGWERLAGAPVEEEE